MKIGIVHYRVGRTDGVSLEITKRKVILESLGHEVHLVAGHFSNGTDYIIPELEVELPEIVAIKENAWAYFNNNTMSPNQLMQRIDEVSDITKQQFLKYHQQEKFDLLLVHNIFSFSLHIAAARAFAEIIDQNKIPTLATNHDYYWERGAYQKTTSDQVQQFLDTYVPFQSQYIKYISINSIANQELIKRRGIESDVLGDFLDFSQPPWAKDDYNQTLLRDIKAKENDLVVLQATRIVGRKGIGLALDFVAELNKHKEKLIGQTLYNGKKITSDSDIVLLLAGFTEKSDQWYRNKLERKITQLGVKAYFTDGLVAAARKPGIKKTYSLWDCYAHADLVTYPSLFEGWGNQFIEAIFAKKPIILFEYSVFKSDIKKEGYHYISLGDETVSVDTMNLRKVSQQTIELAASSAISSLLAPETNTKLDENFFIGRRYHDTSILKKYLEKTINEIVTS